MKNIRAKKGQPKPRAEFPKRFGENDQQQKWSLDYNKGTKRYDLMVGEKSNLSSVSLVACENRALDHGVVWATSRTKK